MKNGQHKNYYEKTIEITDQSLRQFSDVTGDVNPLHLDEEYAKKTIFKSRIAHGMLLGSYIATVIGSEFPGFGSIYLSQTLKFKKPVRIGDVVTIKISVIDVVHKNRVKLNTLIENQSQETVLTGDAIIIPPSGFMKK